MKGKKIDFRKRTKEALSRTLQILLVIAIFVRLHCMTYIFTNQTSQSMVFCYQNCHDLLWDKIVLVIKKTFWNSRLKAENLQNFWEKIVGIQKHAGKVRKSFEIGGWRLRICKIFEMTRTIYSNSEQSEQFLITECFLNLFLWGFSYLIN